MFKCHIFPRRTKYLLSEDLKIVRYILEEELYNETSGKAMWEHMQILKVQSLTQYGHF